MEDPAMGFQWLFLNGKSHIFLLFFFSPFFFKFSVK